MTALPKFERHAVTGAVVRITKAGDGLSEALKITPKALHHGDEVFYILRGVVTQVNHKAIGDDGELTRVHTIEASAITEVDAELAETLLNEAAEALAAAKAEADGRLSLLDGES